jgi:hypothetical protein
MENCCIILNIRQVGTLEHLHFTKIKLQPEIVNCASEILALEDHEFKVSLGSVDIVSSTK